jgi:hypothetical protein
VNRPAVQATPVPGRVAAPVRWRRTLARVMAALVAAHAARVPF